MFSNLQDNRMSSETVESCDLSSSSVHHLFHNLLAV